MSAAIGPGRYSATSAQMSSNWVGRMERSSERTGVDSSWNTPIVSPAASSRNVASSSRGTASMSSALPLPRSMRRTHSSMMDSVRRPRKSIFSRPRSSTPPMSNWVTIGASAGSVPDSGLRWIGRKLVSGSGLITTAAACTESWRIRPSRPRATSTTSRTSASSAYMPRSSAAAA